VCRPFPTSSDRWYFGAGIRKILSFRLKYFFRGNKSRSLDSFPKSRNSLIGAAHLESITLVNPLQRKKVNMTLNMLKPRAMSRVILSMLPLLVVSPLPLLARQPDFGPNVTV
jgi:hypothetical protein